MKARAGERCTVQRVLAHDVASTVSERGMRREEEEGTGEQQQQEWEESTRC